MYGRDLPAIDGSPVTLPPPTTANCLKNYRRRLFQNYEARNRYSLNHLIRIKAVLMMI
jgi:hypothetical protein